jgi:hypothetical protein
MPNSYFTRVGPLAAISSPALNADPRHASRRRGIVRTSIVLLTVAALAAVSAAMARADIGIVSITPSTARPGQLVRVHVNGYLPMHGASMPVVLVRAETMPRPYRCRKGTAICEPIVWHARLTRAPYRVVGFAREWTRSRSQPDHADSVLRIRIPKTAAGRYRFALWCDPCIRGPQGSLIAGPMLVIHDEN